jgi:hypothetical protein
MGTFSKYHRLVAINRNFAKQQWGDFLNPLQVRWLVEITRSFGFSIAMRDVVLLSGTWYVTHAGLLRLANRRHCAGIDVKAVNQFCDPPAASWAFKATVYKSRNGRGFVGHGEASPANVSSLVRGAEMRVAETRAVNRALRKAYGIGLCSVEELGSLSPRLEPSPGKSNDHASFIGNSSGNGQPRLRDRLCLLIRQHQLDPTLVKRYAADFCGAQELREADRELVESFINALNLQISRSRSLVACSLRIAIVAPRWCGHETPNSRTTWCNKCGQLPRGIVPGSSRASSLSLASAKPVLPDPFRGS